MAPVDTATVRDLIAEAQRTEYRRLAWTRRVRDRVYAIDAAVEACEVANERAFDERRKAVASPSLADTVRRAILWASELLEIAAPVAVCKPQAQIHVLLEVLYDLQGELLELQLLDSRPVAELAELDELPTAESARRRDPRSPGGPSPWAR
jgi:hypothetical protein